MVIMVDVTKEALGLTEEDGFLDLPEDSLSPEENLRRHDLIRRYTQSHKRLKLLCGLRFIPGLKEQVYQVVPQVMFKVHGMMLWGVDEDTWIEQILVGQQIQSDVANTGLPAMFFATARSYDHMLEDLKKHGIAPPSWIEWITCNIGCRITIKVRGNIKAGMLWGTGVL